MRSKQDLGARSRQVPPACAAVGRTCVCFCFIGSHRGRLSYSPVSASALRGLATATMASPDFWPSFPTPLEVSSPEADRQISPAIPHSPSRLYLSDLRRSLPCKHWASQGLACSPPRRRLDPLPVRQASALPTASSRFHLAMDTLAVRLTLPLAGCGEDFHLQVSAPCRGAQKQKRGPRVLASTSDT